MFKGIKSIVSVIYSFLKFAIIKLFRWKEFRYYYIERFSPSTMLNIYKNSRIDLGKQVRAHSGVRISSTPGARIVIGDNTAINYNCIIVAREKIVIGRDCTFGPNVVVYDHDHDFRNSDIMNGSKYVTKPIVIGNNVWIGAGAIILKDTTIGDNAVIAAGSIVRGSIPGNSITYNKTETVSKQYL